MPCDHDNSIGMKRINAQLNRCIVVSSGGYFAYAAILSPNNVKSAKEQEGTAQRWVGGADCNELQKI